MGKDKKDWESEGADSGSFDHWLEFCDFCGEEFGISDMELVGAKFICRKCLRENQNLFKNRN